MSMSESDARQRADNIIIQLIQHQPNLLPVVQPGQAGGEKLAELIAGLRKGLTEMFKTQS